MQASLYILASLVGYLRLIYIPTALVVSGNPAATASNIAAHETLFRWASSPADSERSICLCYTRPLSVARASRQNLAILMVILGSLLVHAFVLRQRSDRCRCLLFATNADFLSSSTRPSTTPLSYCFEPAPRPSTANAIFWAYG